jgi:hypothetical protein
MERTARLNPPLEGAILAEDFPGIGDMRIMKHVTSPEATSPRPRNVFRKEQDRYIMDGHQGTGLPGTAPQTSGASPPKLKKEIIQAQETEDNEACRLPAGVRIPKLQNVK